MNSKSDSKTPIKLIYLLYLLGLVMGITSVIALIMAYLYESEDDLVAKSHCRFQIRTFWIGLLGLFISILASLVVIGYLLLELWFLWVIIRVVRGLKYIQKDLPHPNPQSWLFG